MHMCLSAPCDGMIKPLPRICVINCCGLTVEGIRHVSMANEPEIEHKATERVIRRRRARRRNALAHVPRPMRIRGMMDVASVLIAERARRKMNQADMAAMLGLTRQKLQLLEGGQPGVAAESIFRVLGELGVSIIVLPSARTEETMEIRRFAETMVDGEG